MKCFWCARLCALVCVFVCVFGCVFGWGSREARADVVGAIHPNITRTLARLGKGADAYAHLRELWEAWEVADPAQVEEALRVAVEDDGLTPSARVYAGLLEAYARRRRGDLEGARRHIAELGFVSEWLIVGPFNNDNKSGMAERMPPEVELAEPVLFDRSYPGKERAVRWRRSPDVHRWGYLDLGAMIRPERDACGFASTYVRDGRKGKGARKLSLWAGATGAFRLFVDGEMVLEDTAYRQLDADRHAVPVSLEPGFHRVTVKVCADETPASFTMRFAEPDGSVARDLEVSTSDAAINETAQRLRNEKPRKLKAGDAFGPLDRFEQQLTRSPNDAALLESYARYLAVTGGDPEATHQARDLARRAADAAPTVTRLLLAAQLAEDRNGTRELVDRAEPLAKSQEDRVAVLLARARLARTGPNWRDAFPLYDQLLRLDPAHVAGILGKVDLYVEAGLKRTALATLQRAASAQPSSVALLRALAGQLRALGRDAEATEVEARYAALRFDDGSYLSDQLGVAVARRDAAGVRRWAARLTESEPASSWAHDVVARALRAIGDIKGATLAYERALAIAPEDIAAMRALADLHGAAGRRGEQLAYLKRILRIVPQAKNVRAYLEHIEPTRRRPDEAYAWAPDRFLELRTAELGQKRKEHARRVLRQLTVATVFDNGLSSHFHQVVFQPLTDESAARSRQYAFVYHADRQVVQLRAAKVYRKDGRIDEAIESGEAPLNDPSINMYTLQRTFYVQFPRLEPGDVVELRYRIDDVAPRNEMSDYFGEVEYLQADEPIANSEYILLAPSQKRLHVSTGPGALRWLKKDVKKRGATTVYRFTGTNVPPLETEARMPRYGEVAAHVHVSTFASWKQVGAWYWSLARDMLEPDDDVRKLARKLTAGKTEVADKVAAIYHYAATETRYVALEF
ncbi:MAG TPA: DUF3857 domain-containing protein, partial [Polyangiaceae bacterium]|nr:DUF3857 domain-containing protein [Polyangiaceae bacterium]